MPPFGCSEIFKLFPRRVSFRETNLLESSRIFNGIGKSKSPLFLASLWLSALSVSHQPEAGASCHPSPWDSGWWREEDVWTGADLYCLPGHVLFAQHSPSLSKSEPGTVESMDKTLEPQDISPREVLRPHWDCQFSFLGQGGFSLLQHLGRYHSAECEPWVGLCRSNRKDWVHPHQTSWAEGPRRHLSLKLEGLRWGESPKLVILSPVCRRRQWHPTPVLLPGKSHGWRSLEGCSPGGHEESDTTEQLHFHFSLSCIGEGNGNPLQCSCLENPRDGGAWWAAIYGVSQSQTQLKRLGSSLIYHFGSSLTWWQLFLVRFGDL